LTQGLNTSGFFDKKQESNKKVRLVGIKLSNIEKAPSAMQTTLINYLAV
jgi:hypothetical protein